MPATVKATGYVRTIKDVQGKLRYYAFRSRELPDEKRGLFGRTSENADLRKFVDSIRQDPLLQDRQTRRGRFQPPKMHSLVFSLSRDEFTKSGLTSWKPVIREVLTEWERYRGIQLEWVAAEHQSLTHPHCHVAIKAAYTDAAGHRHRLRLTRQDIQELRTAVRTVVRWHRQRHWEIIRAQREAERAERQARAALADLAFNLATGFLDALAREAREPEQPLPAQRRRRCRPPAEHER